MRYGHRSVFIAVSAAFLMLPAQVRSGEWKSEIRRAFTHGCGIASSEVESSRVEKDRVCWCAADVLETLWPRSGGDFETLKNDTTKHAFVQAVEACVYAIGAVREPGRSPAERKRTLAALKAKGALPVSRGGWTLEQYDAAASECERSAPSPTFTAGRIAHCSCLVDRVAPEAPPETGVQTVKEALAEVGLALVPGDLDYVVTACNFASSTRGMAPSNWGRGGYLDFKFGMGPADVLKVLRKHASELRSSDPMFAWPNSFSISGASYYAVFDTSLTIAAAPVRAVFGFFEGKLYKVNLEAYGEDTAQWKRRLIPLLVEKYGRPRESAVGLTWARGATTVELDLTGLNYTEPIVSARVRALEMAAVERRNSNEKKLELDKL